MKVLRQILSIDAVWLNWDITNTVTSWILSMYLHFDNSVLTKKKPNNRNLINGYR